MSQIIDRPAGRAAVAKERWADRRACPSRWRFLGVGLGSGALGGLCCIGAGIAVGAGVGGLSFLSTWVEHYQIYFIAASLLIMALWLGGLVRRNAGDGWVSAVKALVRGAGRQLIVMGTVYVITVGVAMAIAAISGVT